MYLEKLKKIDIDDFEWLIPDFSIKSKVDNKVYMAQKVIFDKLSRDIGYKNYDTLKILSEYDSKFTLSGLLFPKSFYIINSVSFVYLSEKSAENINSVMEVYNKYKENCSLCIDLVKETVTYNPIAEDYTYIGEGITVPLNMDSADFALEIKPLLITKYVIHNKDEFLNTPVTQDIILKTLIKCGIIKKHNGKYKYKDSIFHDLNTISLEFNPLNFVDCINEGKEYILSQPITVWNIIYFLEWYIKSNAIYINDASKIHTLLHEYTEYKYFPTVELIN